MYVIKFNKDGEIWEIPDELFRSRSGYYYRLALTNLKHFFYCVTELPEDISAYDYAEAMVYHDRDYLGCIYYAETTKFKHIAWHTWWNHAPYHHDCQRFIDC